MLHKTHIFMQETTAVDSNQNAATLQLTSDPVKVLQWLEREKQDSYDWVMAKYRSYLEDAPFDESSTKADKLKKVCVCEYIIWQNRGVQLKDGIVTTIHKRGADGELFEVEAERPENQAINRMDQQVVSKLKQLGIYNDGGKHQKARLMQNMSNDDAISWDDSDSSDDEA